MFRVWPVHSLRAFNTPMVQLVRHSTHSQSLSKASNPKPYGSAVTRLRLPEIPPDERALSRGEGVGGGPEGRMMQLRRIITQLFDWERIELRWYEAAEARLYAERLIQEAIRASAEQDMVSLVQLWLDSDESNNKDSSKQELVAKMNCSSLELAYFWLMDPYLVEKLFKVFVPRYRFYNRAYTSLHRIESSPTSALLHNPFKGAGILELHGNPWPPVHNRMSGSKGEPFKQQYLINVLIRASKQSGESGFNS